MKIYLPILLVIACNTVTFGTKIYEDSIITIYLADSIENIEESLNEHVNIIKNVFEWTGFKATNDKDSAVVKEILHTIKVRKAYSSNMLKYWVPMEFSIEISADTLIRRFQISSGERHSALTQEERKYYEMSKRVPASYIKVTETEALESAFNLLEKILSMKNRGKSVKEFDSVNVTHGPSYYIFNINCKQKTDVLDKRYAEIHVEAKTGEITLFSGELFLDYDLDYKPVITKNEAMKIVEDVVKRMGIKIAYYKRIIIYQDKLKNNRMVWSFSIKEDAPNAAYGNQIIIDCENGQILLNDLR